MLRQHAGRWRLALLTASLALLGACDRGDRALDRAETAVGAAGEAVGGVVDTLAGRLAGREYTNAELTGFINAYNDAEIEIGELARTKATDTQVRNFAQRIVQEHRALKTEVTNSAQRLNFSPIMPEADENLLQDHQNAMRELREKPRGREFDEAFLEHEIMMHRKVLDEVEDALGRNRNEEIRAVLETARTGLRGHLETAQELEKKFGA